MSMNRRTSVTGKTKKVQARSAMTAMPCRNPRALTSWDHKTWNSIVFVAESRVEVHRD
jgi:hypothetical protein